jgi:hypothetical protein
MSSNASRMSGSKWVPRPCFIISTARTVTHSREFQIAATLHEKRAVQRLRNGGGRQGSTEISRCTHCGIRAIHGLLLFLVSG